jgi:hypothetical protein
VPHVDGALAGGASLKGHFSLINAALAASVSWL